MSQYHKYSSWYQYKTRSIFSIPKSTQCTITHLFSPPYTRLSHTQGSQNLQPFLSWLIIKPPLFGEFTSYSYFCIRHFPKYKHTLRYLKAFLVPLEQAHTQTNTHTLTTRVEVCVTVALDSLLSFFQFSDFSLCYDATGSSIQLKQPRQVITQQ